MKRAIFRAILASSLALLFVATVVAVLLAIHLSEKSAETSLMHLAEDISATFEKGAFPFTGTKLGDTRLTHIAADGTVLEDSEAALPIENHANRPEILRAKVDGFACLLHKSETLGNAALYCAKRLHDGTFLRLSRPLESVSGWFIKFAALLTPVLLIALFLCARIARKLSNRITAPINAIDLEKPLEDKSFLYDELSPLLTRIDKQNKEIEKRIEEIHLRASEFGALTQSMTEGIFLLTPEGRIASANRSAQKLLATTDSLIGKSFEEIDRNSFLAIRANNIAATGFYQEREVAGRFLRLHVSAVRTEEKITGFIVLLTDVTQEKLSERMRQEFTANVSHELKTPLQSIAGSAELLETNLARAEDVPLFARRIVRETQTMSRLIEDIIFLSRLDEGVGRGERQSVNLREVTEEVFGMLERKALERHVTLNMDVDSAFTYSGFRTHFVELIRNLAENAVKYNREGGFVTVSVTKKENTLILRVQDSGIGISREDLPRVFERFWRADTSHSKTVKGTGLGLSIVKRIALFYRGSVAVESDVGVGSIFTVRLPL